MDISIPPKNCEIVVFIFSSRFMANRFSKVSPFLAYLPPQKNPPKTLVMQGLGFWEILKKNYFAGIFSTVGDVFMLSCFADVSLMILFYQRSISQEHSLN